VNNGSVVLLLLSRLSIAVKMAVKSEQNGRKPGIFRLQQSSENFPPLSAGSSKEDSLFI